MPIVYHITTKEEWENAPQKGSYEAASLKEEGFIHCSEERQVAGVLERYFSEKSDLVRLVIDTDRLTSRYIQEWSSSLQDTFPHIYGPVNLEAVIDVLPVK